MNIGEVAKISGVNAKQIRHYESLAIIPKAGRSDAGYRIYKESDVHILTFVKKARGLGFSMKEIKKLVSLWRNKNRASSEVKSLAQIHIKQLESKIHELQMMTNTLKNLSKNCQGNDRPDCPILDNFSNK
jgi:MerR family copper efflux transcriptional regulator